MFYCYNPLDTACKSLLGAIPRGREITFHIYKTSGGEGSFSAENCNLCVSHDGDNSVLAFPMQKTDDGFLVTLKFNRVGLFYYCFKLGEYYLGCGQFQKGELGEQPVRWQLTVFDENYTTPDWVKGGIIYQIFPDRFYKSGEVRIPNGKVRRKDWGGIPNYRPNMFGKILNNDFFGGNLKGIREKLSYLESLNVSIIYLNPIFEAYSNHRYDTGDYMKIDSVLGTEQDLDELIRDAASRGIKIILDGVFNHTGDNSRYFNRYGTYASVGAYQSLESPYADWYCFRRFPDEYESWWGIETLPSLNENSEGYQNFLFGENGVLKHWLRHGIGGYRLDVVDELPDFFVKKLRTAVKEENGDAVIIGEVWEDASNKIAYGIRREYFQGGELDSVMNYPLKDAIINFILSKNTTELRETIAMLIDHYPKAVLDSLMNLLGTHDTVRIITVFGGKICFNKNQMATTSLSEDELAAAIEKLKMAITLQFTLPGVPSIYYGDEIGMQGYQDPFCRGCFDWNKINCELTSFYQKMGEIRRNLFSEVFSSGSYQEIFADNSCIVYERQSEDRAVYVYVNNSEKTYSVTLKGKYKNYLNGKTYTNKLTIKPFSYGIIAKI